ncbi:unnamed protein product [Adineta ricciae]|nr:unnamed protein product [Adineta ricciae]
MYFRLLSEAIIALNHKQSTKDEFISLCNSQYSDNQCELDKIDEFHRTYSKEHAIRWYTRDSFLFRILNNALRTQDIDVLYKLGFFITDLHHQLKDLHRKQLTALSLPSVVYRGQFMNKDEFDYRIKNNIGGFLSINSFFSTSTKRDVASIFTGNSSSTDVNIESIVFEIKIEIEKCRQPFADIRSLSYMEEEDEILFSVATVFRVESVGRLDVEGVWLVRLIMNGEEDEELRILSKNIKDEIGELDNLNTFCGLLMKMGELGKAEEYCLMLIRDTPDDSSLMVRYYSNLSMFYNEQMEYDEALYWGEKALQICQDDTLMLGIILCNIGLSHVQKKNTIEAINYLSKAVNILEGLPHNHLGLVSAYLNLSVAYQAQGNYSKSEEFLYRIINFIRNSPSINYSLLARTYSQFGNLYYYQNKYDVALEYMFKCLNIQQRILPSKHKNLANSYTRLGLIYFNQSKYTEAYNSCQKALEIIGVSPEDPYIAPLMYILGECYLKRDNVSEAIACFDKAINAPTNSLFCDQESFVRVCTNLGGLYAERREWEKALNCCLKAIPVALVCNHSQLAIFYMISADLYSLINDFKSTAIYYELALDIAYQTLPADHTNIKLIKEHQSLFMLFAARGLKLN